MWWRTRCQLSQDGIPTWPIILVSTLRPQNRPLEHKKRIYGIIRWSIHVLWPNFRFFKTGIMYKYFDPSYGIYRMTFLQIILCHGIKENVKNRVISLVCHSATWLTTWWETMPNKWFGWLCELCLLGARVQSPSRHKMFTQCWFHVGPAS